MLHFTTQERRQFEHFFNDRNAVMDHEERTQARELNRILRDIDNGTFRTNSPNIEIRIMGKHILARGPDRPMMIIPIKPTHIRLATSTYPELRLLLLRDD